MNEIPKPQWYRLWAAKSNSAEIFAEPGILTIIKPAILASPLKHSEQLNQISRIKQWLKGKELKPVKTRHIVNTDMIPLNDSGWNMREYPEFSL